MKFRIYSRDCHAIQGNLTLLKIINRYIVSAFVP